MIRKMAPQVDSHSPPAAQPPPPSEAVAVVVPHYREGLTDDEEISLRHLRHFLGGYDKFLAVPDGLRLALPDFSAAPFPRKFFHDTATYSALMLSADFYRAFAAYEYLLLYQLDALVFSDRLAEWCARGFDYVGAPWLPGAGSFVSEPAVGNGGFSLRRVESFLRVAEAPGFASELRKYRDALAAAAPLPARLLAWPRKALRRARLLGAGRQAILDEARAPADPGDRLNEDCFWSFRARTYYPGFKIAPVEEALDFAFEVDPRRCYELNGGRLPFGCHAWAKYDRAFWEPFLLG